MNFHKNVVNLFFYLGTLFLTLNILTYQALHLAQYKYILRFAGIGMFFLAMVMKPNALIKRFGLMLIVLYSGIMVTFVLGNASGIYMNMIAIVAIMFASHNVASKDLLKIFFCVAILSVLAWILLLLTGQIFITETEATRQVGWGESMYAIQTVRYSLGFFNEINLGSWYLSTAMVTILLYKGMERKLVILFSVFELCLFLITDSRQVLFFYMLFIIIYYWLCSIKSSVIMEISKRIIQILYVIILLGYFSIGWFGEKVPWLDGYLSGRVSIIRDNIQGVSLRNYYFGGIDLALNSSYWMLLLSFGVFFYLYICNLIIKGSNYYLSNNYAIFSFVFSMLLVGLVESVLLNVEELSTIVFWGLISRGLVYIEKNDGDRQIYD